MAKRVDTIVIEPRSLVREALVSLLASHSYHVIGGVASTADIGKALLVVDPPKLVVLGPLPTDEATSAANSIRKLWPHVRTVLLFDRASAVDFQTLLASEIDGCIPLAASPDTLVDTLQQIINAGLRVLVLRSETCLPLPAPTRGHQEGLELRLTPAVPERREDAEVGLVGPSISRRVPHGLSEREEEILKGVVRGHSNKMIARTCGVTDATIKVHMKSILRKNSGVKSNAGRHLGARAGLRL